ncbi:DUF397 domain-containing protein [Micromonospora radicis]|uniref:DUF397 domain-containing protein n=1 Tax=Micromonospora radicis TaxID=1894971 RepID=A0A418MZT6_9ACTN|nr:DUF397 domain-containing protein [Micromonospora radicis]
MPTPVSWRKSSRSCQGNCVEVASAKAAVLVRDSKDPDGPALRISRPAWHAFLTGVPAHGGVRRDAPARPPTGPGGRPDESARGRVAALVSLG